MTGGTFLYAPFTVSTTTSAGVCLIVGVCVCVGVFRGFRSLLCLVPHYMGSLTQKHTYEETHRANTQINTCVLTVTGYVGCIVMKSYYCRGTLVDFRRAFIIPLQYLVNACKKRETEARQERENKGVVGGKQERKKEVKRGKTHKQSIVGERRGRE